MKNPEISLSFRKLSLAQCVATITAATIWWIGAVIGGFSMGIAIAGAVEAGILMLTSLVVLVLFSPNKKRPVATIATLWSATSFVRFLAALGVSVLLYYATQFGLRPLLFSFLLTAIFLLVAETKALAQILSEMNSSNKH